MKTLHDTWTSEHASDFAAGVRLLAAHGGEVHITRLTWQRLQALAYGGGYVDRYHVGKLENALRQIASSETQATPSLPSLPPSNPSKPDSPTSDRAKALHKEHAHAHALLVTAETDAARAEKAREIMEKIIPALDAEYDRLRAGDSPDPEAETVEIGRPILNTAAAATLEKLLSVRSRISTLRSKVNKEKDPAKKAKWEAELDKKIAERDRLQRELE